MPAESDNALSSRLSPTEGDVLQLFTASCELPRAPSRVMAFQFDVAQPIAIPTFRPSWNEFQDFNANILWIESTGSHEAGVVKIVPPDNYVPRRSGYNDLELFGCNIPEHSSQCFATMGDADSGAFELVNIPIDPMSITEYQLLASRPEYSLPAVADDDGLSQIFWSTLTRSSAIYGDSVHHSLFNPDLKVWNVDNLHSVLDHSGHMEGITSSYLYFGMWRTAFTIHSEDKDLYSINSALRST